MEEIQLNELNSYEDSNINRRNSNDINIDINSTMPQSINSSNNNSPRKPIDKNSMFITAKNLSLTYEPSKTKKVKILQDLNFFLKPGSMVMVLGAPGCGKTSLMKCLSLSNYKDEKISGTLLFNGSEGNPLNHHRHVSYVVQDDTHMAPFTVRETLKFSTNLQLPQSTPDIEKEAKVDEVLKFLDLEKHQNTVVGNEFIRGISGGQKKRVTIGIELVKESNLLLMDEPTTGLDSSIAYDFMKKIKTRIIDKNMSCLVSLLQPGIEITNLFDYLMILSEGEMVYFGPMNRGIDYFEELGFKLPLHHNPAEFFQEIVNEPELYYTGSGNPPLRGTEQFVNAYKSSLISKQISDYIDNNIPNSSDYYHPDLSEYSTSLSYQTSQVTKRGFQMIFKHRENIRVILAKNVVIGLILGSLFWQLDNNQVGGVNRSGLIFFSVMAICFGGFSSVGSFFSQREVFYQQRRWRYYSTLSFFISLITTELFFNFFEVILFGTLVYWMSGLQKGAVNFIYFELALYLASILGHTLIRFGCTFSKNSSVASSVGPVLMSPFILLSGFIIFKPVIPGYWIWLFWISPVHYIFEGLMINEHIGKVYTCDSNELVPPSFIPNFNLSYPLGFAGNQGCPITSGNQFIRDMGFHEEEYFKWADLAISIGFISVFLAISFIFLRFIEFRPIKHQENQTKKKILITSKSSDSLGEKKPYLKSPTFSTIFIMQENKLSNNGCHVQWKNLSYEVDVRAGRKTNRVRLLNDINGFVKPGMLLALMGPSGAGKSTLLDVLANRKTGGYTHGEILINGKPRDKFFTRISAYVEQMDILLPTQTVREAIQFSAKVRLPSDMPMEDKMIFVENILHTLNLLKIANRFIGQGEAGLTLSQRKRVNIGIELASDPQLLFLDEPTSGLDSSAALKVMNLIKKIASSGRSIICTIHQPSTTIFKKFDHLLLLKRGGETVFFGPTGDMSSIVLKYFEEHGLSCDPLKNPADFILEVTNDVQVDVDGVSKEFNAVEAFKSSSLNQDLKDKLSAGIMPVGTPTPEFTGQYSSTLKTQFVELFKRQWYAQTRRVQNIRTRIGRSIFLGIVLGTLYLQMDLDQPNIYNRVSNLFFSLMFGGMAGFSTIPVINIERGVFYREQSAGMYRIWIYIIAFVVTDIPWIFLSAIAYQIPNYFLCGFYLGSDGAPFFYQTFIMFLCYLLFTLLSMVLATVLPTDEIAHALGGTSLSVASLFAGFMIAPASIPNGWKWFYHLDPIKYPLEMVMVTEFKDLTFGCPNNEGAVPVPVPSNGTVQLKYFCPVTAGQQILDQYEMKNDMQYTDISVMFGYIVFFIICISIALTFIRHQTK